MDQTPAQTQASLRKIFDQIAQTLPHRLPVSTYRLQFNKYFRFTDARDIVAYLDELGITDVYASPFFKAQPGSMHGYDLTDYSCLNPEIGTEEEFESYVSRLRQHGMGQILDIVPNHMSIGGSTNLWWQDVLENGQSSPFAPYFDIDWKPVKEELEDKVILPILGDQYGRVLENQELPLSFADGGFQVNYYEHRLPLDPKTYTRILGHRLEKLEESLGIDDEDYQELLSIITALNHLPSRTEVEMEKITERRREKEIIKRRLADLCARNQVVRDFVGHNVELFNGKEGASSSFDLLDDLLSNQAFRLAYWRVATEEINYRRFFDINDLAAVRMEYPEVFQEAHTRIFNWIRQGKVTGLRVDHPDGLYNPTAYFRNLQEECFIQLCLAKLGTEAEEKPKLIENIRNLYRKELLENPASPLKQPFYIVGEKILMDGETMPAYWPIFGATGYVFMNAVNGVFIDKSKARTITRLYHRFTRQTQPFSDLLRETKKLIMRSSMASEINVLGHNLNRISENDRYYRDFTLNNLTEAIVEVIAFFPIYRTYIDARGVADRDRRYLNATINKAKRHSREISASIFDFLRDVLLLRYPENSDDAVREQYFNFTLKFQQLTGPVMAKGMEDTAFYIFNRFVSLNEVGGNPEKFGIYPETFHALNQEKTESWPSTLLATSTHDSKRSEDVRARINVLSEIPDIWHDHLMRWSRKNRRWKTAVDGESAPDRNTEYLLYQTLVGVWPLEPQDEKSLAFLRERIKQYMLKASREAKTRTSWINQNAEYEEALSLFIESILTSRSFLNDFLPFQSQISRHGLLNSLSQTLLKITSPGTPDFYQGTELWTFSLVDPDNRTPVDYSVRSNMLARLKKQVESTANRSDLIKDLIDNAADGRIKLFLTFHALNFRRSRQELFQKGQYLSLEAAGRYEENVLCFLRYSENAAALTIVPRLVTSGFGFATRQYPMGEDWQNTVIYLPDSIKRYRNIFTGEDLQVQEQDGRQMLRVSEVLAHYPVALLKPN